MEGLLKVEITPTMKELQDSVARMAIEIMEENNYYYDIYELEEIKSLSTSLVPITETNQHTPSLERFYTTVDRSILLSSRKTS